MGDDYPNSRKLNVEMEGVFFFHLFRYRYNVSAMNQAFDYLEKTVLPKHNVYSHEEMLLRRSHI